MKALFLYSEVAGYFLACAEALHVQFGCEVHIVRWPVNPEAPFEFRSYQGVNFYERKDMTATDIIQLFNRLCPRLVYVSGWMDKAYLRAARVIRKSGIPVICGCDNPWRGDLRQKLAGLLARGYLQKRFSHFMIPGLPQYPLALKLGFKTYQILTGMYAADLSPFQAAYERYRGGKKQNYPHNFLYVGRFVEIKGIYELSRAFMALCRDNTHDWTLTLVGAGPMNTDSFKHERIILREFVQPDQLPALAEKAGCFVLPSRMEPWGVVLQEFAGAGLPLIASENCGSATAFLRDGYNGYLHRAGSETSIRHALQNIIRMPDEQLQKMGKRSYLLSYQFTPESWAASLFTLMQSSTSQSS